MKQYLAIKNKLEKEIGLLYREVDGGLEHSFAYQLNPNYSWNFSKDGDWTVSTYKTLEEVLARYDNVSFELTWYTQGEYESLLAMRELTS